MSTLTGINKMTPEERDLARRMFRLDPGDVDDAQSWGFNCGPAAACVVLGKTPEELKPFTHEFERVGYTNPTLMRRILEGAGAKLTQVLRTDDPGPMPRLKYGVVRIQWGGKWTKPGVPPHVRYRKTHWIAVRLGEHGDQWVFDINAVSDFRTGWVPLELWVHTLVPRIVANCVPDGDGTWWPTHGWEVAL